MTSHWMLRAIALWNASRESAPHELNELDWKASLSTHKERLIEHLFAVARQVGWSPEGMHRHVVRAGQGYRGLPTEFSPLDTQRTQP